MKAKRSVKYSQKKQITNAQKSAEIEKRLQKARQTKPILKKKGLKYKLVKGLAIGVVGLSLLYTALVGSMVVSDLKNSPYKHSRKEIDEEISYVEMYGQDRTAKNINTIIEIAPKGSIVYTDYFAAKNGYHFPIYDQSRIYSVKECKEIKLDIYMYLSKFDQSSVQIMIDFLNNINQKTFTGLPPITVEYHSPREVPLYTAPMETDTYTITISRQYDTVFKDYPSVIAFNEVGMGKICFNPAFALSGSQFSTVLMHELMHEIFGLEDMYLLDNYSNSLETIMNAMPASEFSINDLYLIDALCWTEDLTIEQKQQIREYYKEFADKDNPKDFSSILAYKIAELIRPIEYYDLEK